MTFRSDDAYIDRNFSEEHGAHMRRRRTREGHDLLSARALLLEALHLCDAIDKAGSSVQTINDYTNAGAAAQDILHDAAIRFSEAYYRFDPDKRPKARCTLCGTFTAWVPPKRRNDDSPRFHCSNCDPPRDEKPAAPSETPHEAELKRQISGYWVASYEDFPTEPDWRPDWRPTGGLLLPIGQTLSESRGEFDCLYLVPRDHVWYVLSEVGALTYGHSSSLMRGETLRFVIFSEDGRRRVFGASIGEPISCLDIEKKYGLEARLRAREGYESVRVKLSRLSGHVKAPPGSKAVEAEGNESEPTGLCKELRSRLTTAGNVMLTLADRAEDGRSVAEGLRNAARVTCGVVEDEGGNRSVRKLDGEDL